jgi:hypothetical protein
MRKRPNAARGLAPAPLREIEFKSLATRGRFGQLTVTRVKRTVRGGGFGNLKKHGQAFALLVDVEGSPHCLVSFRGKRREWSSLDRLDKWLCARGVSGGWQMSEETLG